MPSNLTELCWFKKLLQHTHPPPAEKHPLSKLKDWKWAKQQI